MSKRLRIEAKASRWVARQNAESWQDIQQQQLDRWLEESDEHRVAWLRMRLAWEKSARLGAMMHEPSAPLASSASIADGDQSRAVEDEASIDVATERLVKSLKRLPVMKWMRNAAVLTLALGLAWTGYWDLPTESGHYSSHIGASQWITLADGSVVQLNSNTELQVRCSRRNRIIRLIRGEAFFQVVSDPGRPFIVKTKGREVEAVGTRFSVRDDEGDGVTSVAVQEGVVRLSAVDSNWRPVLLPAGSLAQADGRRATIQPSLPGEVDRSLSWREGFLVFRETPLADAVAEFNRYHSGPIRLGADDLASIPIGGKFRYGRRDAFVRLLERGFGLRAVQEGDAVVLYRR